MSQCCFFIILIFSWCKELLFNILPSFKVCRGVLNAGVEDITNRILIQEMLLKQLKRRTKLITTLVKLPELPEICNLMILGVVNVAFVILEPLHELWLRILHL